MKTGRAGTDRRIIFRKDLSDARRLRYAQIRLLRSRMRLSQSRLALAVMPRPVISIMMAFAALSAAVEMETGQRPMRLVLYHDRLSSGLAFYRSRTIIDAAGRNTGAQARETKDPHPFGRDGPMYRFWFPPRQQENRSPDLLATKIQDRHALIMNDGIESCGPIASIVSQKNGQVAGRFLYRVGNGYRPPTFEN